MLSEELIMYIGQNIQELRKQKNLKQIDLASKLDIEDSALRRIETGRTNPTIKTLHKIAEAFEIEVQDLLLPIDELKLIQSYRANKKDGETLLTEENIQARYQERLTQLKELEQKIEKERKRLTS